MVVEDRNAFVLRIFLFPGAGLHISKGAADYDLDILPSQAARRSAAVHRGIAATKDDHAFTDVLGMFEGNIRQPVDPDGECLLLPLCGPAGLEDHDRAAPLSRQRSRRTLGQHLGHAVDIGVKIVVTPMSSTYPISSSRTLSGKRNEGI